MGQLQFSFGGALPRERSLRDDPARAARAVILLAIAGLFLLPTRDGLGPPDGDAGPIVGPAVPADAQAAAEEVDTGIETQVDDGLAATASNTNSVPTEAPRAPPAEASRDEPARPPPPVLLSLVPAKVEFSGQPVGVSRGDYPVTVHNRGRGTIVVEYGDQALSGDFHLEGRCAGKTLKPGESCGDIVSFKPAELGARGGSRDVLVEGKVAATFAFSGQGVAASIELPARVVFEGAETTRDVLIRNSGSADLQVTSSSISGPSRHPFNGNPMHCVSRFVAPGATCTITVTIAPGQRPTVQQATLSIVDNVQGSPHQVALVAEVYAARVSADQDTLDFGSVPVGGTKTLSFTISNSGNAPAGPLYVTSSDGAFTAESRCNATLPANSRCAVDVRFSPRAASTFGGSLGITGSNAGFMMINVRGSGAEDPRPESRPEPEVIIR